MDERSFEACRRLFPEPPRGVDGRLLRDGEWDGLGSDEAELACASGVSASRVYQLFGGTDANPSASTLLQLADALGAGPRDLMKEVSE